LPDQLTIVGLICEEARRNGTFWNPRVVEREKFDLTGFKKQECDIPGVKEEYVNQSGPGFTDDDYHGTIAYQIGSRLFVYEY
jgi:hypothetical protein